MNDNNLNYTMAKTESLLQQILMDLPVGVAYYILQNKANELKQLYYEQAQRESAAVQVNPAQSQDDIQALDEEE